MSASAPSAATVPPDWMLVVDDDEPIRVMVAECLFDSGLEIVTAASGAEALAILDARANEPVLALVDVLMPGIDGRTLAQKLQGRFKRGTIAIMSGHVGNLSWWPMELREVPFLAKPFRLAELTGLVAGARAAFHRKA